MCLDPWQAREFFMRGHYRIVATLPMIAPKCARFRWPLVSDHLDSSFQLPCFRDKGQMQREGGAGTRLAAHGDGASHLRPSRWAVTRLRPALLRHGFRNRSSLQPNGMALLDHLGSDVGRVMLHGELFTRIWGLKFRNEASYSLMWVSHLRFKLEAGPETETILTAFPGASYRLETPAE